MNNNDNKDALNYGVFTVTVNPAVDYVIRTKHLTPHDVNSCMSGDFRPGGKGINVSVALKRLGRCNQLWGFRGDDEIGALLHNTIERAKSDIICNRLIKTSSFTRVNIKIIDESTPKSNITELNVPGSPIGHEYFDQLIEDLEALPCNSLVALCGSLPKGAPPDFYAQAIRALPKGALAVVDTSGVALRQALRAKPFLIKPNREELANLYGKPIGGKNDAVYFALKAIADGAQNVLVSMGREGAVLVTESDKVYREPAEKIDDVCYTVGAGDNLLAGFIDGYLRTGDFASALKIGVKTAAVYIGNAPAEMEWASSVEAWKKLCQEIDEICQE
jgi:1-phosphofructokinase